MAGRPRKSDAEKAAKGTLQKCRQNSHQWAVNGELNPAPPTMLTADARDAWELALQCAPKGFLTALDHGLIEKWCRAYAMYRKLAREVEAGDIEQTSATGLRSLTPTFTAYLHIQKLMLAYEKELGFTPISRSRVRAPTDETESENPFLDD